MTQLFMFKRRYLPPLILKFSFLRTSIDVILKCQISILIALLWSISNTSDKKALIVPEWAMTINDPWLWKLRLFY